MFPHTDCAGVRTAGRMAALLLVGMAICAGQARAAVFTVNSPADVHDANPGNGVCETATGNHVCTLRAAIDEANALAGPDTIDLQADATYLLALTDAVGSSHAGLVVVDSVTIVGAGAQGSTIDGNGATTGTGVFLLIHCIGNVVNQNDNSCVNGKVAVVMSHLTIENGQSAGFGGGIYSIAALSLDHCVVTANAAGGLNAWGGGIASFALDQSLAITSSVIAGNSTGNSNAYGGGVFTQSPTTIVDSTISGNSTGGNGGGLALLTGAALVKGSTIVGNHAARGGGIYGVGITLINSTVSANYSSGDGGGIYHSGGTTGLYNTTVAFNQANSDDSGSAAGGGITNLSGTFNIANSIISENELVVAMDPFPLLDVDECSGTITSLGNNILTNVKTIHCFIGGPYAAVEPLLGALAGNGGPTQTHALQPGSPAIDAGNPGGCTDDLGAPITTDQRGIARPYGPACDIGAFEFADEIFAGGFDP